LTQTSERSGSDLGKTFVEFNVIKQQIPISAVLEYYGIQLRRVNRSSLRGQCPLPTHVSPESNYSFSADAITNWWACHSASCVAARQGRKGGDIIAFVAVMETCSARDAAMKLAAQFLTSVGQPTQAAARTSGQLPAGASSKVIVETNKPLPFTLKGLIHSHGYLNRRGFREETARHFGAGFFPGRGSMAGRVIVPIHNENGELVAYVGRSIDAPGPKYRFPTGFRKSAILFNLHRVLALRGMASGQPPAVIVVEGFFDCMKVHQAGFPAVVALMGSSLSDMQKNLLNQFRQIVLFLDGDRAGTTAAKEIGLRLMYRSFVRVLGLADGRQPDQLSSDEIRSLLGSI
jgi:DNA primase